MNRNSAVLSCVLSVLLAGAGQSQNIAWREYVPPDLSFKIKLPKGRVKVIPPNAKELKDTFIEKGVGVYLFLNKKAPEDNPRFQIFVFDLTRPEMVQLKKQMVQLKKQEDVLDYFALMALGDDDAPSYLSSPKDINSNGLSGKEYNYIDTDEPFKHFSRGRLIESTDRLFILVFNGKNEDDLTSSDASQFFDSFEIPKALTTNKTHRP